ncbi:MAG: carboxynorspermidine decarboxylase [Clostridiaceae bacterium]|nr:carboxynorspermidine decarboxylase [Clostridiaceae bacterium]
MQKEEITLDKIAQPALSRLPLSSIITPSYVIDENILVDNLRLLGEVAQQASCRILLAQKAFACFDFYPLIAQYLDGAASSGLFEARLAREEMGEEHEVHVYAPAYKDDEFAEILDIVDVVIFNSFEQWERHRDRVLEHNLSGDRQISCGLRINPGYSEIEVPLYDPARADSRLGVPADVYLREKKAGRFDGLKGLHFHALCEQNADVLERVLGAVRLSFGSWPADMHWLNLGGGHLITKPGYDIDRLVRVILQLHEETDAVIYLEPGEAIAHDAGYLVASVVDLVQSDPPAAILDVSATCHMPDVLEMPYQPRCFLIPSPERRGKASTIYAGAPPDACPYKVQLSGPTCLAGDIIGQYSFDCPPLPGDHIVFTDMAVYTMVKNNTFNGMPLPSIMRVDQTGKVSTLRTFTYDDFKGRLGTIAV